MASSGVTTTGDAEFRAAVQQLPARVTAALKNVAHATALRIQAGARARLQAPDPPVTRSHRTGRTAAAITVVEDSQHKTFRVESPSPAAYSGNLVLWIEHGTRRQPARPYMRPAAKAEEAAYRADMEAASVEAVNDAIG